MSLTLSGLDTFVSQGLSALTAYSARSLDEDFPQRSEWISEFVMRRIFHNHISDERAALAFVLLRRAEAAIDEWRLACSTAQGQLRSASVYFKTLRHFEACIANLWQGLDFGRRALDKKIFEPGDGIAYERLNEVYNTSRHFKPLELPSGNLHAVWLTNSGLRTETHEVSFEEIREALAPLGRVAVKIVKGRNVDGNPAAA
jgi:hypothetical protein